MKSGVLLLNKPTGPSSARALYPVKRAFPGSKVGHTGTLDPFASGLLVLLIGNATRLARWFSGLDKRYRAVLRFGLETDTLDNEGEVIARCDPPPRAAIEAVLPRFLGEIRQVPPAFSAIKIGGRRAYELARSGSAVQPEARTVRVDSLALGDGIGSSEHATDYELSVGCGSGTYIRSLARDIGLAAGSRASLIGLERTAVGPFTLDEAISSTDLERLPSGLMPLVRAVERLGCAESRLIDDENILARLRNGAQPPPRECDTIAPDENRLYLFVDNEGREVAMGQRHEHRISYEVVFPGASR